LQEEADGLVDHLAAAQSELVGELLEGLPTTVGNCGFDTHGSSVPLT
jgi:hypothetical protein